MARSTRTAAWSARGVASSRHPNRWTHALLHPGEELPPAGDARLRRGRRSTLVAPPDDVDAIADRLERRRRGGI